MGTTQGAFGEFIRDGFDAGTSHISLGGDCPSIPSETWGPAPQDAIDRYALVHKVLEREISIVEGNKLSKELGWTGEYVAPLSNAEYAAMVLGDTTVGQNITRAIMVIYGWETPFIDWVNLPPPSVVNLASLNPLHP